MTQNDVMKMVSDPLTHYSTFDAERLKAFVDVWTTRRMEAKEIHKREDLRKMADGVLDFVRDREPQNIQMHISKQKKLTFLFDNRTNDYVILNEKCHRDREPHR